MPVRHIGRVGTYKGKFLFHLLCNLNSGGVGRMVVRDSLNKRYKEPCYYIIKKSCPDHTSEDLKAGYILAEQIFRGKCLGEMRVVSSYKPDWKLVPKDEEMKYTDNKLVCEPTVAPVSTEMPPLLASLVSDRYKRMGIETEPEDLKLFLKIARRDHNNVRQPLVDKLIESLPEEEKPPPPLTWKQICVIRKHKKRGTWIDQEQLRSL